MSFFLKCICPPDGFVMPVRQLKRVVLPAPFGPIILAMEFPLILKLTPSTAEMPPKCLVTSFVSRMYILLDSQKALGPEPHEENESYPQKQHPVQLHFAQDFRQ